MHSFLRLPLKPYLPQHKVLPNLYQLDEGGADVVRNIDILIIDEISMVRCDMLDATDMILRHYRNSRKPFGGVQLLMIGDLQQLAPVANDQEWSILKDHYSTPYFFSSHALEQIQYVTIELKHIYRQSDEGFINLLAKIRSGELDNATIQELNKRYIPNFVPPTDSDYIRLTTHNYKANEYNRSQLSALSSQSHVFQCKTEGSFPDSAYPADSALELKIGSQVMFLKNDIKVGESTRLLKGYIYLQKSK